MQCCALYVVDVIVISGRIGGTRRPNIFTNRPRGEKAFWDSIYICVCVRLFLTFGVSLHAHSRKTDLGLLIGIPPIEYDF